MLKRLVHRAVNAGRLVRLRGVGYLGYLLTGHLVPRFGAYLLYDVSRSRLRLYAGLVLLAGLALALGLGSLLIGVGWTVLLLAALAILAGVVRGALRRRSLRRMHREARRLTEETRAATSEATFTRWETWPVDAETRAQVEAHRRAHPGREVVLGRFDPDGRVLSPFGPLPGLDPVDEEAFTPRHRFGLDVVLVDGAVLVRKDFRGARQRFVREWYNLAVLRGRANVPAVYRADEDRCVLYKNLIAGRTLRSLLVEAGARILLAQTEDDPSLEGLEDDARIRAVWERGRAHLAACVPSSFLEDLEQQMDRIHAEGVARLSLTFGNIILEAREQTPWLIDMEGAEPFASTRAFLFRFRRDQDRQKFNDIYDRRVLTERTVRAALASAGKTGDGWYAPIDFGGGLAAVGNFWTVESGTGRWELLNRQVVPSLVRGRKVLDLGSNNGVLPLLMLRGGACEVLGIERDPAYVARARFVHDLFEWRDLRRYAFRMEEQDMLDAVCTRVDGADVVTAFCSLYYLSADDMARVVRRAARSVPTMILQANDGTRDEAAEDKAQKSSTRFLERLLRENGYPSVEVHAPPGYSRPLLVGRLAPE